MVAKLNVVIDARSVWVKVWPCQPFPMALSVTPFNLSVTLLSCIPVILDE